MTSTESSLLCQGKMIFLSFSNLHLSGQRPVRSREAFFMWRQISQFSHKYSIQFSSQHLTIKSLLFVIAITGGSSTTVIWQLLRFSIIKIP